jgi:hypothetical protein
LYQAGYSLREVGRMLSVTAQTSQIWVNEYREGVFVKIEEWIYDIPSFTHLADRHLDDDDEGLSSTRH